MKISEQVEEELNKQINEELYSAYLYLSMSSDFEEKKLSGFSQWLKAQAKEEVEHAMRFYNHIVERGRRVILTEIKTPPFKWSSPLEAFTAAYKHEQHITGRINFLLELANNHKDHATAKMLKWFVDEQAEEEESADEVVQKLMMAASSTEALHSLDREMAKRK